MDDSMKLERKGMGELTRQMLNKAIDLLHKVSNKKMESGVAKKELIEILSSYFLYPLARGSEKAKKRFKSLLEEVCQIVDKIDSGKAPLYEAIMQMNKAVMHLPQNFLEEEDSLASTEFDSPGITKERQFKIETKSRGKSEEIQDQITRILDLKERLQTSVTELNNLLSAVGFELIAK